MSENKYECCPLYKTRKNIVWERSTADKDVNVLFIGEAPGKDEDLTGQPFVGRAGKILDEWIFEMDLISYAIINVVKCRPPKNRVPTKQEINACLLNLIKQIRQFNPKIIVALGRTASTVLTGRTEIVANIGKVFNTKYGPVFVMPHPSYILRGVKVKLPLKELKKICDDIELQKKSDKNGNNT